MNERENRNVLRRFRKTARVEADVTSRGRLFQTRLPATGKACSPTVASRVRRTTNNDDDHDDVVVCGIPFSSKINSNMLYTSCSRSRNSEVEYSMLPISPKDNR